MYVCRIGIKGIINVWKGWKIGCFIVRLSKYPRDMLLYHWLDWVYYFHFWLLGSLLCLFWEWLLLALWELSCHLAFWRKRLVDAHVLHYVVWLRCLLRLLLGRLRHRYFLFFRFLNHLHIELLGNIVIACHFWRIKFQELGLEEDEKLLEGKDEVFYYLLFNKLLFYVIKFIYAT